MTVSVTMKPEIEAQLVARALSSGQSLEGYIQHILEHEVFAANANPPRPLTGAERAEAFEAWVRSFPSNLPAISLECISRENIYRRD